MKSARLSGRRMDLLLVSSGVKLPGNGQLQQISKQMALTVK